MFQSYANALVAPGDVVHRTSPPAPLEAQRHGERRAPDSGSPADGRPRFRRWSHWEQRQREKSLPPFSSDSSGLPEGPFAGFVLPDHGQGEAGELSLLALSVSPLLRGESPSSLIRGQPQLTGADLYRLKGGPLALCPARLGGPLSGQATRSRHRPNLCALPLKRETRLPSAREAARQSLSLQGFSGPSVSDGRREPLKPS